MNRRNFMQSAAFSGVALRSAAATTGHPVPVKTPRSTSGDPVEPNWAQRLTLTVGPKAADLIGSTEKVVQAAVDSIARWGGGTVKILPGNYHFRNAVYLQNNVRILGSGVDSVITKQPSVTAKLSEDSDWFDQEITFADAAGLEIGDGICLRAKEVSDGSTEVIKRTLVARSGNRFKLDRALRKNVWLMGQPTVETLFPLFSGENIGDITIENITLDGNKSNNGNLDGNYAGCIWLQDCNRITMRKVIARNYNGDGISWQICHDVLAEECDSHDHTGLGLHPGSGSQRSIIRGIACPAMIRGCSFAGASSGRWPRRTTSRTVNDTAFRSGIMIRIMLFAITMCARAEKSVFSSGRSAQRLFKAIATRSKTIGLWVS